MSDYATAKIERRRFRLAAIVAMTGWGATLSVCLMVIGAALYQEIHGQVSETLKGWAGTALGFLLGSAVIGLVSKLLDDDTKPGA